MECAPTRHFFKLTMSFSFAKHLLVCTRHLVCRYVDLVHVEETHPHSLKAVTSVLRNQGNIFEEDRALANEALLQISRGLLDKYNCRNFVSQHYVCKLWHCIGRVIIIFSGFVWQKKDTLQALKDAHDHISSYVLRYPYKNKQQGGYEFLYVTSPLGPELLQDGTNSRVFLHNEVLRDELEDITYVIEKD